VGGFWLRVLGIVLRIWGGLSELVYYLVFVRLWCGMVF